MQKVATRRVVLTCGAVVYPGDRLVESKQSSRGKPLPDGELLVKLRSVETNVVSWLQFTSSEYGLANFRLLDFGIKERSNEVGSNRAGTRADSAAHNVVAGAKTPADGRSSRRGRNSGGADR